VERLIWRGSKEELEIQKLRAKSHGVRGEIDGLKKRDGNGNENGEGLRGGFWNGGEEGAREIGRAVKLD